MKARSPATAKQKSSAPEPEPTPPETKARQLVYMPLSSIQGATKNPKQHAAEAISTSIGRFGYIEPVVLDERTGRLVAGHGRIESLRAKKLTGEPPPEGVKDENGEWLVPVLRGWKSRSDTEAQAYLLASNQLTFAGGWDEGQLSAMLAELDASKALDGVGFSDEELQRLLGHPEDGPAPAPYTSRVEAPVYKPTGEKPSVTSLCDPTKAIALSQEIDRVEGLEPAERTFLKLAAQRHVVFDYQAIAEFYAHASAPMQRQMEKSALVIIDFNQAIELGFVRLSEAVASDMVTDAT